MVTSSVYIYASRSTVVCLVLAGSMLAWDAGRGTLLSVNSAELPTVLLLVSNVNGSSMKW
jgi:hypothetical protein